MRTGHPKRKPGLVSSILMGRYRHLASGMLRILDTKLYDFVDGEISASGGYYGTNCKVHRTIFASLMTSHQLLDGGVTHSLLM